VVLRSKGFSVFLKTDRKKAHFFNQEIHNILGLVSAIGKLQLLAIILIRLSSSSVVAFDR